MQFFDVISYEEALSRMKERMGYLIKRETVRLAESLRRIAAEDVFSPEDLPAFSKSVVDGYALRAADTYGASENIPSLLQVKGTVAMGEEPYFEIQPGEAVYIPTGGMLPRGADSVVMIEHTQLFQEQLAVQKSLFLRENTLNTGEDIRKNAPLLKTGETITPHKIGLMAGLGVERLSVFAPVSFYIISTGDEIVPAGIRPRPGQIRDINAPLLSAQIRTSGHTVAGTEYAADTEGCLQQAIAKGIGAADIVLITGGSSVGERDFTYSAIQSFDKNIFIKGVALKPGKPTVCGTAGGKLVAGLPGHPMAAAIVYKMLIEKAINDRRGTAAPPKFYALTGSNFPSSPGRTACLPVKCEFYKETILAVPVFGKSGVISAIADADGFIVIPANKEGLNKDEPVAVFGF